MQVRTSLIDLKPYSIDEAAFAVKLDANERPLNLPESVRAEVSERLNALEFNRYPDMGMSRLRDKIAASFNLAKENILLGNGSSELLQAICYVFGGQGKNISYPSPSFSMYPIYAKLADSTAVPVQLEDDFSLAPDKILVAAKESQASLIILCNPNNPTGTVMAPDEVEYVVANAGRPVVVDEAYYEFYGESSINLIPKYTNLIVTRTFSKAYGLAAARAGYLAADAVLAGAIAKGLLPYHVNALTLITAEAVFDHRSTFDTSIVAIIAERQRLIDALNQYNQLVVYPSAANFVLVKADNAADLNQQLLNRGIGVRDFSRYPGLAGCLRITIGTAQENNALLNAVADYYMR